MITLKYLLSIFKKRKNWREKVVAEGCSAESQGRFCKKASKDPET